MAGGLKQPFSSSISFILGAGASAGYFPSTPNLTKHIIENVETSRLNASTQRHYFKDLNDACSLEGRKLNFEELVYLSSILHEIADANSFQIPKLNFNGSLLQLVTSIRKEFIGFNDRLENGWAYQSACLEVLTHMNKINNQKKTTLESAPLNKFLRLIKDGSGYCHIFSLNYDTLPLYSGIDFETGFEVELENDPASFAPENLMFKLTTDYFCQLHGSINFACRERKKTSTAEIVRLNDSNFAEDMRRDWKRKTRGHYNPFIKLQDGTQMANLPMITGLRKADSTLLEPYGSYLNCLFQSLVTSNSWVFVGYSGADFHVNSVVARAWEIRTRLKHPPKVVFVDYLSDSAAQEDYQIYQAAQRYWSVFLWPFNERVKEYLGSSEKKVLSKPISEVLIELRPKYRVGWLGETTLAMFSFEGTDTFFTFNPEQLSRYLLL